MPRITQIQDRRDTAANWTSTNPVLASGEHGYETDTGKFKIGDGTTAWTSLVYAAINPSLIDAAGDLLIGTADNTAGRLAIGTLGKVLTSNGTTASWETPAGGGALDANATLVAPLEKLTITSTYPAVYTAPTVIGAASAIGIGTTLSVSLTGITGLREGDVVFAGIGSDGGTTVTISTAGYTALGVVTQGTEYANIGYKVMGATVDASVDFAGISTSSAAVVAVVRGVNSTILDTAIVTASGGTGDPNPGSITTVTNNALVLAFGFQDDDNSTLSPSSGYTTAITATGSTAGQAAIVASKAVVTAGAEDPGIMSSAGDDEWIGFTVAVRPGNNLQNLDVKTASVLYQTSTAAASQTVNVRGDSSTTLNSIVEVGESITVSYVQANGAVAYSIPTLTIDGTAQTIKWQGGATPTLTNLSCIEAYVFNIIKTASATYTVFGSVTKFA